MSEPNNVERLTKWLQVNRALRDMHAPSLPDSESFWVFPLDLADAILADLTAKQAVMDANHATMEKLRARVAELEGQLKQEATNAQGKRD